MLRKIFLSLLITLSISSLYGQTKNSSEFLRFSKSNYSSKNNFLKDNHWETLDITNKKMDSRGVLRERTVYGKNYLDYKYLLFVDKNISRDKVTEFYTTTLYLPTGDIFDTWVEDFEKMGFIFERVGNFKGKLFAGKSGVIIRAEIFNMDKESSEWRYSITILTGNNIN